MDFFHNISEKAIKPFYYAALLFLIVDALFILIGVYIEYVKEMDFMEKYSDFPISPVLLILSPFMIPITLWCIVFSLFLIIFFIVYLTSFFLRVEKVLDENAIIQ